MPYERPRTLLISRRSLRAQQQLEPHARAVRWREERDGHQEGDKQYSFPVLDGERSHKLSREHVLLVQVDEHSETNEHEASQQAC